MDLPSRGERESAATTREIGFFFEPTRVSLSFTAIRLPSRFLLLPLAARLASRTRLGLRPEDGRRCRCSPGQLRDLARSDRLHHLRHLLARLDQLVDLFDGRARAGGDPLAARGVDDMWDAPLVRRHRQDDCLDLPELAIVDLAEALQLLAEAGDYLEHALQRPHAADHLVAREEVVEAELALHHAALELLLLVLLDRRLGALDQREDVAHAEDPRRHPVRVEPVERIELLAE